jgi:hypothetical protein
LWLLSADQPFSTCVKIRQERRTVRDVRKAKWNFAVEKKSVEQNFLPKLPCEGKRPFLN